MNNPPKTKFAMSMDGDKLLLVWGRSRLQWMHLTREEAEELSKRIMKTIKN